MNKMKSFTRLPKLLIVVLIFTMAFSPIVEIQASTKAMKLNKTTAMVKIGETVKLTATNASSTVKWSTENKSIATVNKGLVTAKSEGTVNIVASYGTMSATCKITVYQPAKKVVLSVENDYIEVGDTFKVTAQITPEDATYKTFTWSVENNDAWYPAIKQVSKNKFKALGEGTATIIAYQKDTKKKYQLRVEVKEALGTFHIEMNDQIVTSLTTVIGGHALVEGTMDASDEYWDESEPIFRYSIKDTKIASIDDRGQITAIAAGSTSVIVTAISGKSASCELTVKEDKETLRLDTFYADKLFGKVGVGNYGDWGNWSSADNTYLFILANNQIGVFNHISSDDTQSLQFYLYDQDFNYISQSKIELPYSEWGGIYQGEDDNYYVALGQTNTEQDNLKNVFSILKLDADFKEVGRCNITGAESSTRIPYDVGFARMTMDGTTLIVHTDRERYTSPDGRNHQSNITFVIDSATMVQSYVGELFPYNHSSHSFNQFVKMDGDNLIYVDHGDAYPRAVVMQTHYSFTANGWSDDNSPELYVLDLMNIVGAIGDNYTGTKVNGFEIGTYHNMVAGVSIPHDSLTADSVATYDVQNVYVSLASKNGTDSKLIWLTDYKLGGGISANNLRMVKITEDEFALTYQISNKETKSTGLIIIDSNGNIKAKQEYNVSFSCYTQPIYYDNSIVWIDSNTNSSDYYWYEETADNVEQCQFTRIYLE